MIRCLILAMTLWTNLCNRNLKTKTVVELASGKNKVGGFLYCGCVSTPGYTDCRLLEASIKKSRRSPRFLTQNQAFFKYSILYLKKKKMKTSVSLPCPCKEKNCINIRFFCTIAIFVLDANCANEKRIEEKSVVYICTLSWSVHHSFVRDGRYTERGWTCTHHPHQTGLNLLSRWNVRQKVAIASLFVFVLSRLWRKLLGRKTQFLLYTASH